VNLLLPHGNTALEEESGTAETIQPACHRGAPRPFCEGADLQWLP
jgi:hypothetical protein